MRFLAETSFKEEEESLVNLKSKKEQEKVLITLQKLLGKASLKNKDTTCSCSVFIIINFEGGPSFHVEFPIQLKNILSLFFSIYTILQISLIIERNITITKYNYISFITIESLIKYYDSLRTFQGRW